MGTSADDRAARSPRSRPALQAVVLVIVAALLTALLAFVAHVTRERIERNEQAWIRGHLDALLPPQSHDNDLLADSIAVVAPDLLGSTHRVARRAVARAISRPLAVRSAAAALDRTPRRW
jgi:Na+-translocating ferredoxin:NAD+ oxidoreductase subunit G